MRLNWIKKTWIIPLCLLAACSRGREFDEKYYTKEQVAEWTNYAVEMDLPIANLAGKLVIVANSTVCGPCINEIQYWDLVRDETDTDIFLVLVEKYKGSYHSFLSNLNVQMPAFRDSTALIFEKQLIPMSPVKIYFNTKGEVDMIYPVGADGRKEQFLNRVNNN